MRLSVALCTYNGETYIAEQLKSILNQSVAVDEIIISDDGSNDKTLEIAQEILDNGGVDFKIVQNGSSKGIAKNFLQTMKMTTGDYCFTADQDDIWCLDKVEIFLKYAQQTKMDVYFSDGILVDAQGKTMNCKLWDAVGFVNNKDNNQKFFRQLLHRPYVTGAAMMVSRGLIDQVDTVPTGVLHDEWFSMLAAARNSIQSIPEQTFLYRQHGNNVVGARRQSYLEKAKLWYQNLKIIEEIRQKAYNRVCIMALAANGTQYENLTEEARIFWETMCGLTKKSRFSQILVITRFMFQKKYTHFYTGLRGYVRDVMSVVFTYS